MKKWLFYPFEFIAGWTALFIGLVVILITAIVAYYGHIHLDGVLDLHEGQAASFATYLLEGAINWLTLFLFTYLAGLFFSGSSFRVMDVLGTQALARFPFLISCFVSLICFDEKILNYFTFRLLRQGEAVILTTLDLIRFGVMILVDLILVIWTIVLMYRAYSISCNVKGNKGIFSFAAALVLAEVLSKILLTYFVYH